MRRGAPDNAPMLVLQTPRLNLRWFRSEDAADLLALMNDEGWLRYIGDRGLRTEADARAYLQAKLVAPCHAQGFGLWAVGLRGGTPPAAGRAAARETFVGICGLVRREGLPTVDLGYALLPAHRGQGFVHEAAAATLAHAHQALGFAQVMAITHPDNAASAAVLRKLGFAFVERRPLVPQGALSDIFQWTAPHAMGELGHRLAAR